MESLPNYNLHLPEHNSDNGEDAVALAQFYMQFDKTGNECKHGVNYETGYVNGKAPNRDYVLGSISKWLVICPCCTQTSFGGNWSDDGVAYNCNGGLCTECQ